MNDLVDQVIYSVSAWRVTNPVPRAIREMIKMSIRGTINLTFFLSPRFVTVTSSSQIKCLSQVGQVKEIERQRWQTIVVRTENKRAEENLKPRLTHEIWDNFTTKSINRGFYSFRTQPFVPCKYWQLYGWIVAVCAHTTLLLFRSGQ